MSLSLDTPLQQNAKYTFHFTNGANGLIAPLNGTVVSKLAASLSDEISGISSTNPSIFASGTYDIAFTFVGFQGTTVGDLSNAMNDALSGSTFYSDLIFSSADGGSVASPSVPSAPPGAPGGVGGPPAPPFNTKYIWYGVGLVILLAVGFAFAQGLGKGVGEAV